MKFNRSKVKQLRNEIATALASVEKKHGVSFDLGRITFTDTDFRGKLTCKSADPDAGRKIFERDAVRVGVKKEAYGKTFTTSSGRTFRITGINTRAKKYPVNAETVNTKEAYKFAVTMLPKNLRW